MVYEIAIAVGLVYLIIWLAISMYRDAKRSRHARADSGGAADAALITHHSGHHSDAGGHGGDSGCDGGGSH